MAKIPPIAKLNKEDFAEYAWAEKLLWPLNRFMTSVAKAFDRQLTVHENLRAEIKTFTITENNISYPLSFAWNTAARPTDLIVSRVISSDGSTPTAAVWAFWNFDGESVLINKFHGLDATKEYIIRMMVFAN